MVNIFEGARRIGFLIQFGIGSITIIYSITQEPFVVINLSTDGPDRSFIIRDVDCDENSQGELIFDQKLSDGSKVNINLCFQAIQYYASNEPYSKLNEASSITDGEWLIPFDEDKKNGSYFLGEKYSVEVSNYIKERKNKLVLTKNQEKNIISVYERKYREKKWANAKENLSIAGGFILAIFILQFSIGWVVRGFLGIPRGRDFKDVDSG